MNEAKILDMSSANILIFLIQNLYMPVVYIMHDYPTFIRAARQE
mgnify:CR=1 FL=1